MCQISNVAFQHLKERIKNSLSKTIFWMRVGHQTGFAATTTKTTTILTIWHLATQNHTKRHNIQDRLSCARAHGAQTPE